MTGVVGLALTGLAFLALFLFGRRAGKDAVKAKAAEESLDEIRKANAPLSDPELERVRNKWRRD